MSDQNFCIYVFRKRQLQEKVPHLLKKVLWGSKSFRFLQILSAANQQYAGARTPDRQQAKGFAAASLLLYSANAMRSDEDSLRSLTGITKFIYFHPHKKSTRRIPVLYTTTLYHYTSSFTAFHFRLGKIPYIFINIHIIFDVSKQRNLIAP